MKQDLLHWLQEWYNLQCDGDWEHEYGVKLETIDNPGWCLLIDLNQTSCDQKVLNKKNVENTQNDWYSYGVVNNKFEAFGGPNNLQDMLTAFSDWAMQCEHPDYHDDLPHVDIKRRGVPGRRYFIEEE